MPRWLLPFEAIDPTDFTNRWSIGIHQSHYEVIRRHGHEKQVARIVLVDEVIADTKLLFHGWSRPGKEDCYVYAGNPDKDFKSLEIQTPPPPNMTFLVFVTTDGTVDDWNWRGVGEDGLPIDITGELIWQATQNS